MTSRLSLPVSETLTDTRRSALALVSVTSTSLFPARLSRFSPWSETSKYPVSDQRLDPRYPPSAQSERHDLRVDLRHMDVQSRFHDLLMVPSVLHKSRYESSTVQKANVFLRLIDTTDIEIPSKILIKFTDEVYFRRDFRSVIVSSHKTINIQVK